MFHKTTSIAYKTIGATYSHYYPPYWKLPRIVMNGPTLHYITHISCIYAHRLHHPNKNIIHLDKKGKGICFRASHVGSRKKTKSAFTDTLETSTSNRLL